MFFLPVAIAYAEDAAPAAGPISPGVLNIGMFVVLFLIFYFLLIRPQQKRAKEHKQMLSGIQKGDNVVTNGGIYGRVTSINDDTVMVEVADNVRIKIAKDAITIRKTQG